MSLFLGWNSALISAGTSINTMQSTFASLISTTGTHPWQIVRQGVVGTAWNTGGTPFTNPGNAFDMSSTTSATTSSLPAYIGIYYASGFVPTQMYVQADNSASLNYTPTTFTLDYSDNGSSWTTLQSFTSQTNWLFAERRKYAISGAASHNYWRMNVTAATSGSTCNVGDFQLEDINGNWLTTVNFFDCIPPTTETIGNSYSRDVLRWSFPSAGTSIIFRPVQELLTTIPQLYSFSGATAGAVTCSITINSNTVSYVGSSGNTALQNARGLYEAVKASANANFTAWNWVWATALVNTLNGANFYAVNGTSVMNITITSSNITTYWKGTSVYTVPMVQGSQFTPTESITIDLINGWIYYLQICSRGIAIGSKTNSNYYTPIHMCYGDNASTISQLPTADLAAYGIPCTPIELMVGADNAVGNVDGGAYITHWWGVGSYNSTLTSTIIDGGSNSIVCNTFSHHTIAGQLQDYCQNSTASGTSGYLGSANTTEMAGEGIFQGTDVPGVIYSVHKLSCNTVTLNVYLNSGTSVGWLRVVSPNYSGLDWYKFSGTAPSNEQLLVSQSSDFTTTVSTTGLSTDVIINVSGNPSTIGFPSSGWLVLDGEIISYSGVTTSSFTGCVRGKYTTTPVSPIAGTTVYIGAWYCFLVQGLIFAGYQIPT